MNLNINFLSVDFESVKERNGFLSIESSSEINKRVSFGFLSDVVTGNLDRVYGTITLKVLPDILLVHMVHFLIINKPLNTNLAILLLATGNLLKTILISLVLLILLFFEFRSLRSPIFLGLRSLNHQSLGSELLT